MLSGDSGLTFGMNGDDIDVFEKFILDNPSERLDLSSLDLGTGSGTDVTGDKTVNGQGTDINLSLGLGPDDWIWRAEGQQ